MVAMVKAPRFMYVVALLAQGLFTATALKVPLALVHEQGNVFDHTPRAATQTLARAGAQGGYGAEDLPKLRELVRTFTELGDQKQSKFYSDFVEKLEGPAKLKAKVEAKQASYELVAVCAQQNKITTPEECAAAAIVLGLTVNNVQNGLAVPYVHSNQNQYHDGCVHRGAPYDYKLAFMDPTTHPSTVNSDDHTSFTSYDVCKAPPSPTPSPTSSPTSSPSPASSPTSVSGKGDPHLVNVHGQKFDLYQPGVHPLIRIPKSGRQRTALLVQARASRLGADCADLYFTEINVTGTWVRRHGGTGLTWAAADAVPSRAKWHNFHQVGVKVIHGHTALGTRYLNILVRGLNHAKVDIGGLLGGDDHTAASTPSASCKHLMTL